MTAAAPNRLIHHLVGESASRVTQVRAGQHLAALLEHDAATSPDKMQQARHPPAASLATDAASAPADAPSSFEQFDAYAGSKLTQAETLHQQQRRMAVARQTKEMKKVLPRAEQPHQEAVRTRLAKVIAVVRRQRALLKAKRAAADVLANPHVAFTAFRHATISQPTVARHDVNEANAGTKEPLRFGDQICLISTVSDVPLAIGSHGYAIAASNAVIGSHMVFTMTDFRNPARGDQLVYGEDVWLEVDSEQLAHSAGADDNELVSLVMDAHFYLGCPGAIEDDIGGVRGAARMRTPHQAPLHLPALHASNTATKYEPDQTNDIAFKLATMKALQPSPSCYGQDEATREYAIETNPGIMRLARWCFCPVQPARYRDASHVTNQPQLVLNSSLVSIRLNDGVLEYDATRERAVVHASMDTDEITEPTDRRPTSTWQVRLIRRAHEEPPSGSPFLLPPVVAVVDDKQDRARLEWIERHQELVSNVTIKTRQKRALARNARRAYNRVAAQSNAKVAMIEQDKTRDPIRYYQRRSDELEKNVAGHSPHARSPARLPRLQKPAISP